LLSISYWANAILALVVGLGMYFAPAVIAFARRHRERWAISALNLVFGWTVIGWIGAFVWALRNPGTGGSRTPPSAAPRFDSMTGRPIVGYDPQTGAPVLGERATTD
jgi:H+/Cl- antiporter ClcA